MALTYPEKASQQPPQTKLPELMDLLDLGVAQGKADRYQFKTPQQSPNAAPLSQFGLTTPPDQLRALFANPETRPFAMQMVQKATALRAVANDALLRQRVAQLEPTPPQVARPAAGAPLSASAPQSMAASIDQAPTTAGGTEALPDDPLTMIIRQKADKVEAAAASKQWAIKNNTVDPITGIDYSLPIPGTYSPDTPVERSYSFGTSYGSTLDPLPLISAFGNGLAASIPIAGPYLKRTGEEVDAAFANWWNQTFNINDPGTGKNGSVTAEDIARRNARMARHNPAAAAAGNVAGQVLPAALLGELPLLSQALGASGPILQRAIMTILSNQAINTGDNLAKGQPPLEATANAVMPSLLALPNALLGREVGDNMTPQTAALIDILSPLIDAAAVR